MTAISVKVHKDTPPQRKRRPDGLEVLTRTLIILCTALSITLSSAAVCDGRWLQTDSRTIGLWHFCSTEPGVDPDCTTRLGESRAFAAEVGMPVCRAAVSLAVVAAIFSLELQVISQMSSGEDSARRWVLGSVLVLVAATASASGVLVFLFLHWEFVCPTGVTLIFWCQLTSVFLFLLNGLAGWQIHCMNVPDPHAGVL